jgi:hypothetical protein
MMMMTPPSVRSLFSATLALAVALLVGAGAAQAQSSSSATQYEKMFKQARQTAKQGVQAQKSDDIAGAVQKYETAYRNLAEAADLAQQDGQVEAANQIKMLAAKLAYRAGSALHNNDQSQEAVAHFEFGQQVAPPSYTQNTSGLQAARKALKQGPIVDASRALRDGNPRRTIELLSEMDEQTATSYFYQAVAHQELGNPESAVAYASRALDAGGLGTSKRGQLYLTTGEVQMQQGNTEQARRALEQAADLGSPQVSDRAEALLEQL